MQKVRESQENGQRVSEATEEIDIELEMTYLRQGEASGTTEEEEGQLDAFSLSYQAA